MKQYFYIVQSSLETSKCKIGITNDLKRQLKEYNAITGVSSEVKYSYLFTCEVSNMKEMEQDIKNAFSHLREQSNREIYFFNPSLFDMYVDFIKSHPLFITQSSIRENKKRIIKPMHTPSMTERGISRIDILNKAKRVKDNEFYTRYEDVEKELLKYPLKIWQDKCVFCNCDDAIGDKRDHTDSSAFALYFLKHFFRLGLKKLIGTHYGSKEDLFNAGGSGYIFTKEGVKKMKHTPPNYTGGFEEAKSLRILNEEADIVCTNPPFSHAIEYWDILIKSKKKFIILSNITIPISTAFIPYFANKKVWGGFNSVDWYLNPKRQLVRVVGIFLLISLSKIDRILQGSSLYHLMKYQMCIKKYDDSNTLLLDNNYIPVDYSLPFAVSARQILNGVLECGFKIVQLTQYMSYIEGKSKFKRTLIQKG